ncbi:hypothetical protein HK100_001571 [Physocladia obscura]|uniref:Uncharacterized protein n=1 Tax=Physocladia obscura TaxID=109957 RepID=A0AAD5SWN0_9FUNG|nr:hypothetical protein HK100_001571 [Physocladia obscura]
MIVKGNSSVSIPVELVQNKRGSSFQTMMSDWTVIAPCFPKIPDKNPVVDTELKQPGKGMNNAEVAKDFHKIVKWSQPAETLLAKMHSKANVYAIQGYAGKFDFYKIKAIISMLREMRLIGVANPVFGLSDLHNYMGLFSILYSLENSIMSEHTDCLAGAFAADNNHLPQAISVSAKTSAIRSAAKPPVKQFWGQVMGMLLFYGAKLKNVLIHLRHNSEQKFCTSVTTVQELVAEMHEVIGGEAGRVVDADGYQYTNFNNLKDGDVVFYDY